MLICVFRLCNTDNEKFEKALLEKYGIRNCVVRLVPFDPAEVIPKKAPENLRLTPQKKSLQSNVSWMPLPSTTQQNSSEALSSLATYHKEINFKPTVTGKNMRRQRAKSVFVESILEPNDANDGNVTMDDLHMEFRGRYNSPNRGLKLASERQIPEAQPKPISQYQKIYDEFVQKLAAKKNNK